MHIYYDDNYGSSHLYFCYRLLHAFSEISYMCYVLILRLLRAMAGSSNSSIFFVSPYGSAKSVNKVTSDYDLWIDQNIGEIWKKRNITSSSDSISVASTSIELIRNTELPLPSKFVYIQ